MGYMEICQVCEEKPGTERYDPFMAEIHEEYILKVLCDDCYSRIAEDI